MHDYLISSVECHAHYFVLNLEPALGSKPLDFLPGQYAAISFKHGNKWSPARCFSFVNSPRSETLRFAGRYSGRFTRLLAKLQEGTAVKVQGPYGAFTLDPAFDKQVIMLAAGIGITPFMSMLKRAAETKLSNPITLLYACRTIDDIPFYEEISALERQNPNLHVAFLVSGSIEDKERRIFSRRLDESLLRSVNGERFNDYSYFICGTPGFTKGIERILRDNLVDSERIIAESFTQATKLGWGAKFNLSIPSLTYAATGLILLIGIAFFMALDLTRYVPKAQASTTKAEADTTNTAPNSPVQTDQTDQNPAGPSDNSTTNSPSNSSSTTNSGSGAVAPAPTYTQTYQPPVSSVS